MSQSILGVRKSLLKNQVLSCRGEGVGVCKAEGQKGLIALLPKPSPYDDIPPGFHDPGL